MRPPVTRAEYVGFVFFPPSPRYVTPARARSLAVGPVAHVGLFVDPTDAQIASALDGVDLDVLQLVTRHPERVTAIRRKFGRPVWRAIGIQTAEDLPITLGGADALLLDAKATVRGLASRGKCHELRLVRPVRVGSHLVPWVLAGGLTPGNVAAAIAATAAPAVDVSSGVERAAGGQGPGNDRGIPSRRLERRHDLA